MARVLAKLATKTLIPTGEGAGGFVKLTSIDVSHALSGLPSGHTALLRAMYAKDHGQSNIETLHRELMREARRLSEKHHWNAKIKTLEKIVSRVIDEAIHPGLSKCSGCGGSGHVQPNQYNTKGDCRLCGNTGERRITDEETAFSIGVTLPGWRAQWRKRFVMIYSVRMSWESVGLLHLRERLL